MKSSKQESFYYYGYYDDGNTVRKHKHLYDDYEFQPAPQRAKPRDVRALKAQGLSVAYGFFLVVMAMVLLVGCIIYLNLRNDITAQQKTITSMERELGTLRQKNDEELDRIEGTIDMEKIKQIAMDEMGMTYPESGQVVDVEGGTGDYVRQYQDIPEKVKKK
ncbi:MAG: hypothetical protein IK139_04695 [Lachnospiraceae bacterium]|nr:hypothetical protein [Lachnospiraceae bacterium]